MVNIYDLHNDFLTEIKGYKKQENYIKKCKKQGLFDVCSAVWTTTMERDDAFAAIERAKYFSEQNNVKFAIEDLHFACNLDDVQKVAALRPSYVGLTWNDDNKIGGGAKAFSGLTEFGASAVRTLEECGIQIDTAHLNEKSFLEFSRLTEKPVFFSHGAIYSLKNHPRNLKDYQLKIIEETGVKIDISDEGAVSVCGTDLDMLNKAVKMIEIITTDFEEGMIFTGKVISIKEFGAFVEFAPGKEGMVHISKISKERIKNVEDVLTLGDTVKVVCLGKDKMGRVSFSMKDVK